MKIKLIELIITLFISLFICTNNQEHITIPYIIHKNFLILLNRKMVTIENDGIHFYNSDLITEDISKKILFKNNFSSKIDNEKISIVQFSEDNGGYIMILVFNLIYFFNSDGVKINTIILPNLIRAINYCLTPYKKENNYLYYIISYPKEKNFYLLEFRFNIKSFENQIIIDLKKNTQIYKTHLKTIQKTILGLSCIFMTYTSKKHDILTCFYIINFPREIHSRSFEPYNNFKKLNYFFHYYEINIELSDKILITAFANNYKNKTLISLYNKDFFWMTFDFDNSFSYPMKKFNISSREVSTLYSQNKNYYFKQNYKTYFIFLLLNKRKILFNIFNDDCVLEKQGFFNIEEFYYNNSYFLYLNETYYNILKKKRNILNLLNFVKKITNLRIKTIVKNKFIKNIFFNKRRKLNNENDDNNKENIKENDKDNSKDNAKENDKEKENDKDNEKENEKNNNNPPPNFEEFNQEKINISNISLIDFEECEQILKKQYNIDINVTLIIYQVNNMGKRKPMSLEVYEPINNTKLDLKYCNNTKLRIEVPVDINENEIFKYDIYSSYYNDICFPYTSENGTDVILSDRRREFFKEDLSLCKSNCDFHGYNRESKNARCECGIETEDEEDDSNSEESTIDEDKFFSNFINITSITNIEVLKCYKITFTKDGLIKNYGSYIIFFIILIYIIYLIYFIVKGYSNFINKIDIIIKKKNCNNNKIIKTKIKRRKTSINFPPKKIYQNKQSKEHKNISIKLSETNKNKTNIILKLKKSKSTSLYEKKDKKCLTNKDINKNRNKTNNKIKKKINYNDFEINSLNYKEALKIDKRTFCQYYLSLLRTKHIFIFTFITRDDYNSFIIKFCLFCFGFALYLTVNVLFFNDSTMHKIYEDNGNFNFIYQIPQIIYSTIISSIINYIIRYFSLSEKNVLKIKTSKNYIIEDIPKVIKCLRIKFLFFFLLSFIFLFFFWFYLSCFCSVYTNTQKHAISNSLISFGLSLIYPFALYLIPGMLRSISLNDINNNKNCMYKISQIL